MFAVEFFVWQFRQRIDLSCREFSMIPLDFYGFSNSPPDSSQISNSTQPLRQPRPTCRPNQFVLFVVTSSRCGLPNPPAHGCSVCYFVLCSFLHCFVDFLRLCLRFPALCRTLLHVSEPLRLKRLLKHPATEAAVTETCRNIHVLSCFLHVLKQSRI